jgi:hypothetical protein
VIAIIAIVTSRPVWPPKILNTCSLVLFAVLAVLGFTPRAHWWSPTFKKINRVLSAAWGVAIFAVGVSRVAAAAINEHTARRWPELLLGLAVPGVIILYMLKFSKSYPDRVTHEPANALPVPEEAEPLVKRCRRGTPGERMRTWPCG